MGRRKNVRLEQSAEDISNQISSLVDLQKKNNEPPTIKYYAMLLNLDRMLQKLPENIVEDLNMKFTQLTFDEIKRREE